MAGRLEGKVAVVTGAGNGIGRACAVRFAREGADVVVADLLAGPAAETAELVERAGARAVVVELDAASPASNDAMAQAAIDRFGRLDVVVTAAGISHGEYRSGDLERDVKMLTRSLENAEHPERAFLDEDITDWQTVLDVNLTGTMLAVKACVARMVEAGTGGAVVTIASIAAKDPDAGPLAYTVSKAGVWMFTKKAARMLAPAGIRVNAIGPGFIRTNMTALIDMLPDDQKAQFYLKIPMGRVGEATEVADVALFLVSGESSYMTGEILHPDGGWFTE